MEPTIELFFGPDDPARISTKGTLIKLALYVLCYSLKL
jgi:hypothetical protein